MKKYIWFYWSQGWDAAPWFVKQNFMSFVKDNPGWSAIFLDDKNLNIYSNADDIVKRNISFISRTAFSDVLRLDLLHRYGGAWIDATVLSRCSLDDWLPDVLVPSGFFSFRSRCVDRDLASWHLASLPGNYLVAKWLDLCKWYWQEHDFNNKNPWSPIIMRLEREFCTSLDATEGFFSDHTLRELRVYPYFWVNYLHQRLMRSDEKASEIWQKTPDIFCGPQSTFLQHDPLQPPNDYCKMILKKRDLSMLKFDRRKMPEILPEGSSLQEAYARTAHLELPTSEELQISNKSEFVGHGHL